MGDLSKLRVLSGADRWLLLEAMVWLSLMRVAIALLPFRRITTLLRLIPGESPTELAEALRPPALRIGWAVRAAATRTPWESTCLMQALAGSVLLCRRDIHSTLYLGVAKDTTVPAGLAAHAWLRCGDAILTGSAGRERFSVVSTFTS